MAASRQSASDYSSLIRRWKYGPQPQGTRRELALHLERLEDRCLMNADPAPISAANLSLGDLDNSSPLTVAADVGPGNFRLLLDPAYRNYKTPPEGPSFDRIDELPAWLVAEADQRYGDLFGEDVAQGKRVWLGDERMVPFADVDLLRRATGDTFDTANSFSTTNTQVAGVDEADLVETDGEFLYLVAGDELLIVDVRDTDTPMIASRVQLNSRPTGMYLSGDRLALISSRQNHDIRLPPRGGFTLISLVVDVNRFGGPKRSMTEVQVLDIADASDPQLVQRTELDGHLVSSRVVDGQLRMVVQQSMHSSNLLPLLDSYSVGFNEETQQHELRYETRNEYLGRMYEQLEAFVLPGFRTLNLEGEIIEQHDFVELDELEATITSSYMSATTLAVIDTLSNKIGPAATKTIFTLNNTVIYATEDSLYLFGNAQSQMAQAGISSWGSQTQTDIWKFDFDTTNSSISLSAQGFVDGRVSDQFAADEHEGFLRVVTTGRTWSSGQDLFVLKQVGKQLKTVGKISDIAPNENLHSVRFLGDEAFVVTFRKVDPLFAIDLSDPMNPEIVGELKIPGFSDYLQPLGEDHLLGVGRGADERIGRFQELQLSIFNVSDLNDPQLAHRYSFGGGRSTNSAALLEHHAVSYFPESEILTIPIYSRYQGGGSQFGVDNSAILEAHESALQVFQVDVSAGFEPLATIKHDSRIIRSLRIAEQLIVVSNDYVTIHDLAHPNVQLATLNLEVGSAIGLVELMAYVSPESLTGLENPAEPTRADRTEAIPRTSYVPVSRAAFSTARGHYRPATAAPLAARDIATERMSYELPDQLVDELAVDLASDLTD